MAKRAHDDRPELATHLQIRLSITQQERAYTRCSRRSLHDTSVKKHSERLGDESRYLGAVVKPAGPYRATTSARTGLVVVEMTTRACLSGIRACGSRRRCWPEKGFATGRRRFETAQDALLCDF